MTALAQEEPRPLVEPSALDRSWATIVLRQPHLASTGRRYLEQISISLSASSVVVADQALRDFEVQMGLVTPETARVPEAAKEMGPAQTKETTTQK